jgi:hypothetical protein
MNDKKYEKKYEKNNKKLPIFYRKKELIISRNFTKKILIILLKSNTINVKTFRKDILSHLVKLYWGVFI